MDAMPPGAQGPGAGEVALGVHLLLEVWGVQPAALDDCAGLEAMLVRVAREGGATVVDRRFTRFSPQGVSGVVVLAESHVAIHTWPEHGVAALDVFTCGAAAVGEAIAAAIQRALAPTGARVRRLQRAFPLKER